jgi:hypothetical protein
VQPARPEHHLPNACPQVTVSSSQLALHFAASLLQLRGTSPSTSPLTDERGHVLCFNGELFGGLDVPSGRNDGKQLLAALAAASVEQQPSAAIPALLSRLRGPWSLLFWQQEQQRLWFGRDVMGGCRWTASSSWPFGGSISRTAAAAAGTPAPLLLLSGRRSLLLRDPRSLMQGGQQQQPWQLVLSSVAPLQQQQQALWIEVPPGVYSIGAEQLQQLLASTYAGSCGGSAGPCTQAGSNGSTTGLVRPLQQQAANEDDAAANGGVQSAADLCALLPGLQHHAWQDAELLQLQQYARDSTASAATQQQQQQEPGVDVQLYAAAQQLLQAMEAAVRVRCLTINTLEQQQAQVQQQHADAAAPLPPAPVLVLFSGGVDSTLIAALAHRVLPPGVPIDLSNVCFDGGRSADRIAARAAMLELAATAPDRPWRLIEVDSSLQEVDELSAHIKALLQPAATVMDWNIGSALWLAARATGRVRMPMRCTAQQQQASGQPGQGWHLVPAFCQDQQDQQGQLPGAYRSAARVVLLGHGADEQCGGYGRHRTK